jgi:radical SAM superfamily enzyme YgiQ (UPF0313 family)
MKLRILLVNPWIYDFAAYSLWARPLGLLRVAEYLSVFDVELSFIDCMDSVKGDKYGTGKFRAEAVGKPDMLRGIPRGYKRYGISVDEFTGKVRASLPADVVLMTSLMSYWYPGVQKAAGIIRDIIGDVPIILGGIYATLYQGHASLNSGADLIYRGPLNEGFPFALYTFGFRLKRGRSGDKRPQAIFYESAPFAPLLTSSGCPFRCSYCASNLLAGAFQRRSPGDVLDEVGMLYREGVRDFAFYDDALLADPDDFIKPFLRGLSRTCPGARFHTPNGLHARFIDSELAALMRNANFRTVRLSLETVHAGRQKSTGNKVNNDDLRQAVEALRREGFTKREVGVYLMYGLPGQGLEEVREGIRFLKDLEVGINLAEFSPIKGTRSWQELVERGIIDDDLDPLLTNNTVFAYLYSGYDPREVERMKLEVKEYNSH